MKGTLLALLCSAAAGETLHIHSNDVCPSETAVRDELVKVSGEVGRLRGTVDVRVDGGTMMIELAGPTDDGPHRMRLSLPADCQARAQAVAVVAASWLGDVPAGDVVSAPAWTRPRAPLPPLPALLATSPPVPAASGRGLALGLGVLGSLDAHGGRAGLRVDGVIGSRGSRLGWEFGLVAAEPRDVPLGAGTVGWMRIAATIAPAVTLPSKVLRVTASGGPVAALTLVRGRGFDVNRSDQDAAVGLHAGLRLAWPFAPRRSVWIDLRGFAWPLPQRIHNEIRPVGEMVTTLPSWEGHLALGASFEVFERR